MSPIVRDSPPSLMPFPGSLSENFSLLHRSVSHKRPATLICVISPSINLLSVTMSVIRGATASEGFNYPLGSDWRVSGPIGRSREDNDDDCGGWSGLGEVGQVRSEWTCE